MRKLTWNTKYVSAIIETRLLSTEYTESGRKPAEIGPATDLYQTMGYDNPEHVLFFPSLLYATKWHHWDDDVDYAFERWREGGHRGDHGEPREIATYCEFGHYPFANDLMLEDGTPVAWDYHVTVAKHPEWRPGIPSEIRWYLKRLGILNDAGVNQLRRMIAQWWS